MLSIFVPLDREWNVDCEHLIPYSIIKLLMRTHYIKYDECILFTIKPNTKHQSHKHKMNNTYLQ